MSTTATKPTKRQRQHAAAEARAAARRKQQRRRTLGRVLGGLALAAALIVAVVVVTGAENGAGPSRAGDVTVDGPARAEPLVVGQAIPDFSAPGLAGGRVAWSDHEGAPTVLSIWAPWCPSCQKELPIVDRVVRDIPGVSLVTIVTAIGDEPGPTPEGYLADNGLTFPTAVDDRAGTLAEAFGITGFPTLYFVSSDGTVAEYGVGELSEARLRTAIGSLA
ncbi:MAG TPA: TlpA disulfide reductase family protein [Actinomycetota bacterium]|nr:TlpA disulfide reductase family protein [Actinomycetota bacterium]